MDCIKRMEHCNSNRSYFLYIFDYFKKDLWKSTIFVIRFS